MLNASYYMLQWLADAPYAHICYNIEQLLRQKIADSCLLDIAATSMPQWQTEEVREEENGQTTAASRTGMAFECANKWPTAACSILPLPPRPIGSPSAPAPKAIPKP
ncbi:hypothetical protein [Eikenella corrodens]|uniref:hypothetical protein n=1 Tax=Eikenella corrodens TaxID=539 RepID=UPI0018C86246|nr:hypothetical protein [Eikenella corrodens]